MAQCGKNWFQWGDSDVFRGFDSLNMDSKGRLALPGRYHERVEERCQGRFVVTVDLHEACLVIYPLPEWELIEKAFNALPGSDKTLALLRRRIVGYATEIQMDNSGRLLISPELREFAALEKEVVLAGQGKKCELWNRSAWEAINAKALSADFSSAQLAQAIDSLAL